MASCPHCGIAVAFHGEERIKCWNCRKPIKAIVNINADGFRKTTAVPDDKKKK